MDVIITNPPYVAAADPHLANGLNVSDGNFPNEFAAGLISGTFIPRATFQYGTTEGTANFDRATFQTDGSSAVSPAAVE